MDYDLFLRMLKDVEIFYLNMYVSKCEPGGISSQTGKRIVEQSRIRTKYVSKLHDKIIVNVVNSLIYLKSILKIGSPFASNKL
jgi:hypothetical protein